MNRTKIGLVGYSDKGDWVENYTGTNKAGETYRGYKTNDIVHTVDGIFASTVDNNTTKPSGTSEYWKTWVDLRPLSDVVSSPLAEYMLEQSSNPEFHVTNDWAARMYLAHVGGYMMRVVNGQVYAAKLNASNWNYFDDGSAVDDASKYETMVNVPKCYFKASGKSLKFGGLTPIDGGHYFDSPEWVGAYEMYVDGSGVGHSRPDVSPSHSRTMSAFWDCAQKLGPQFGEANYGFYCLINTLHQVKYGNLNSQSTVGAGWQHSNWEACRNVNMGLTRSLGDGTGSVLYNDSTLGDQHPTKLFGFEDLCGKLWEFRPGIRFYMDGSQRYAVVYSGNQVSNTANGRKFAIPLLGASGKYVTQMMLGEYWDMIPKAVDGSASTYYCDGYWDASGGQLLLVGAIAADWSLCGLSCAVSDYAFSSSGSWLGARLAFYGNPIIVSGTELMAM